jgi:hypothetical protein
MAFTRACATLEGELSRLDGDDAAAFMADLGLTDKQFKWLKANGAKYGLINLPSESWHWQLSPKLLNTNRR